MYLALLTARSLACLLFSSNAAEVEARALLIAPRVIPSRITGKRIHAGTLVEPRRRAISGIFSLPIT